MASFWAMLNSEQYLGTTLHFIEDTNIDTGSIITQSKEVCDYSKSYYWNVLNIYKAGSKSILDVISRLGSTKNIASTAQIDAGNYYSFPTQKDLNQFNNLGYKLFDENGLIRTMGS